MFVSETGSSFYVVKPKPQVSDISWSCGARGTNLVFGFGFVFGLSAVQRKGKKDTVNKDVCVGDDVC